ARRRGRPRARRVRRACPCPRQPTRAHWPTIARRRTTDGAGRTWRNARPTRAHDLRTRRPRQRPPETRAVHQRAAAAGAAAALARRPAAVLRPPGVARRPRRGRVLIRATPGLGVDRAQAARDRPVAHPRALGFGVALRL